MSKSIQLKNKDNEKIYPCPYYPVGSIYLSVNNTNPSEWFGGTWEQIAQGRTLVGVDINDTNFNAEKKIGGEKTHKLTVEEMPSHMHQMSNGTRTTLGDGKKFGSITANAPMLWDDKNEYYWSEVTYVGGSQSHNNMPPYFTCYIWCRTA